MASHNNCNGCDLPPGTHVCDFFINNFHGECPCTICIVKTMCGSGDECGEHLQWRSYIKHVEGE